MITNLAQFAGNLYITDISFARIFKISGGGPPKVVAGNGTRGFSGDGGPATSAALYFPTGVAIDSAGNLFIADSINNRIRKVSTSGIITTVTGNENTCCYSGDGGPAIAAQLNGPSGLAADSAGNLFIVDAGNGRVRKVSPGGIITTFSEGGAEGVAVDDADNVFIADHETVRKVSANGTVTPVASTSGPLAIDAAGNLFIAEFVNSVIRKVSPAGKITIVAGNGTLGFSGDGGPAINAQLENPTGVAVDGADNIFIADSSNLRTRRSPRMAPLPQSLMAGLKASLWTAPAMCSSRARGTYARFLQTDP